MLLNEKGVWDKACFALFPSWQLPWQGGWIGEEQAGVPSSQGSVLSQDGKGWFGGLECDRAACASSPSALPVPAHTPAATALLGSAWSVLCAGSRTLSTAFGALVTRKDTEIETCAQLGMGSPPLPLWEPVHRAPA